MISTNRVIRPDSTAYRRMLVSIVVTLAPITAWSLPLAEYVSDNFVVYSDQRETQVREFVEELEIYRFTALLFMGNDPSESTTPLTVHIFSNGDRFAELGLSAEAVGLYRTGSNGAFALFQPSYSVQDLPGLGFVTSKANPAAVTRHQYAHHILRSSAKSPLPPWYEAGLASLLTVSSIEDYRVSLGAVPFSMEWSYLASRTTSIREVLIEDSLSAMENDATADVSGTAWLLTHYLLIDSMASKRNKHRESLPDYLNNWTAQSDPIAVFEASFGVTVRDMDRELKRYRRKGNIPVIRLDRPKMTTTISRRELSQSEAAYVYARAAYELGANEKAAAFLSKHENFGRWSQHAKLLAATLDCRLDEQTGPSLSDGDQTDDASLLSLRAELAWSRYESCDANNVRHLDDTIRNSELAIQAGLEQPAIYRLLGLAHQMKGASIEAARNLMRSYELNPTYPRLNLELALFLQEFGRPDLAAPFAGRAAAWATKPHIQEQAANLSAQLTSKASAP